MDLKELMTSRDDLKYIHYGQYKDGKLIMLKNPQYGYGLCTCDDGYLCECRTKYLSKHPELLKEA